LPKNKVVATENQENSLPKNTWRILGLAAVLLLIVTVSAIGFISAGFFDPKPVGESIAHIPLQPQSVPAGTQSVRWLIINLRADSFSLRLTAAYQSGDLDSGYGLALGSDESALVIAISPLGYTTITQFEPLLPPTIGGEDSFDDLDGMIANGPTKSENNKTLMWPLMAAAGSENPLLEWQPWPHIHSDQETNEIWLDKRWETITVRINRELLWIGSVQNVGTQVGLWTTSFNQEATIDFESLILFSETARPLTQPH
jgi:hypothetical protein